MYVGGWSKQLCDDFGDGTFITAVCLAEDIISKMFVFHVLFTWDRETEAVGFLLCNIKWSYECGIGPTAM